jgi:lysophospholipase
MKMTLLILAILMQTAQAIPELNFVKNWHKDVAPFFAQGNQRSFVNHQGLKLNYYSFCSSKNTKTLVILPGRTEPALKYAELVYDLRNLGFNIYVFDHQGQGSSDRLLKGTDKGHVKIFVDYARDLSGWLDEVVIPETKNQERILISHSMGGAISAIYLAYGKNVFNKAVFSAPMMELDTKPYAETIARLLSGSLVLVGQGTKYAPDRGPYVAENDTFEKNEVTHSQGRFDIAKAIFVTWPEMVVGGPTNRWVNQSLKATKDIETIAPKVTIPILFLQAGKDLIVKLPRQDAFCHKAPNCKLIKYDESMHEILQEKDSIRDLAMTEIKNFLKD